MSIYNVLLIIDDIDSLPIEEQREVIYTLSNIVNGTVDGVRSPSRVLFTSRTDQSLPPSNIVRVEGFEITEFSEFLDSMCAKMHVNIPKNLKVSHLHRVTSGSPLFAGSIVRLVRLGMSFEEAMSRWKSTEGEEARRFSFERELSVLSNSASRVLYACCLLGETSISEIAEALDCSTKMVIDNVSELQSYHLIITNTISKNETKIKAPDDVNLTRDILKRHLSNTGTQIEKSVGRIKNRESGSIRKISIETRSIVEKWKNQDFDAALILSKDLAKQFPRSGDVYSLVACTYMFSTPPNYIEADKNFKLAFDLGSTRPDLSERWIEAKRNIDDWTGITEIVEKMRIRGMKPFPFVEEYARAIRNLVSISFERQDYRRASEISKKGIERIGLILKRNDYPRTEETVVKRWAEGLVETYISTTSTLCNNDGDLLDLFDAVHFVFECNVNIIDHIDVAIDAIERWWNSVEMRRNYDERALEILATRFGRIMQIEREFTSNPELFERLNRKRRGLGATPVVIHQTSSVGDAGDVLRNPQPPHTALGEKSSLGNFPAT